jgi:hypothetical protein
MFASREDQTLTIVPNLLSLTTDLPRGASVRADGEAERDSPAVQETNSTSITG